MRNLAEIREDINSIDEELVELFRRRMDCSRDIAAYKKTNNIPILNFAREDEILDKVSAMGEPYGEYTRSLYVKIMELSRELQSKMIEE